MANEDYVKHYGKLINLQEQLLTIPNVNQAGATILCSEIEKHINLLKKEVNVDIVGNETELLTRTINDFFKSLDKNDDAVFSLIIEFRQLVAHVNVSLINKFNDEIEGYEMNTQNTTSNNNAQEEILENVSEAKNDLKDALKDAKEAGENAQQNCGDYWTATNIVIAGTAAAVIAGAAAFVGYKYGYSAGQEECPVIINVGSME